LMPYLHFFECETRTIKCNADERCRRWLDGGEPLFAPFGADANESRHSDQIRTKVMIPLVLQLSFFFFLQNPLCHKAFQISGAKEQFYCGYWSPLFVSCGTAKKQEE
jgi:hypothetical protein